MYQNTKTGRRWSMCVSFIWLKSLLQAPGLLERHVLMVPHRTWYSSSAGSLLCLAPHEDPICLVRIIWSAKGCLENGGRFKQWIWQRLVQGSLSERVKLQAILEERASCRQWQSSYIRWITLIYCNSVFGLGWNWTWSSSWISWLTLTASCYLLSHMNSIYSM